MKTKDIFSNCRQLDDEITRMKSAIRNLETQVSQLNGEIQQLENAKIATRLEFGSATHYETVRTRENALREINITLDTKIIERERVLSALKNAQSELLNQENVFNSLGCRNII